MLSKVAHIRLFALQLSNYLPKYAIFAFVVNFARIGKFLGNSPVYFYLDKGPLSDVFKLLAHILVDDRWQHVIFQIEVLV